MYYKKLYTHFAFSIFLLLISTFSFAQTEQFSMRQLACGLSQPWEITFGPDGFLWATEANSYQITRIDPATGNAQLIIDLSDKKNFPNFNEADKWPQGGLQGLVFHPEFKDHPYLYLAYVYQFDGCLPDTQGCYFKTRIVRYNYAMNTRTLSNEVVLVDTIPGSTDHNGGRLAIDPDSKDQGFLFYGVGDMGAGQLGNSARPHHGQLPGYYEGKILRFNLLPDADLNYSDSWIPNDNPFNTPTRQSAVWSLGHRNPQGLVFSPDGILYESEHGPYSDDEINIIKPGYNYGFPLVMGFADGNYDGSKAGGGSTMPAITSETANRASIQSNYPYGAPIASFFPAPQSEVATFYTNDLHHTPPYANYYLQYPTSAPSGIDYYSSDAIPGWKNSLLVTNLKLASVFRLKLSVNGTSITSDTISYFQGLGRFRDLAISPDGTKIYVACDSVGAVKGDPGESVVPPNKGCILEFTFTTTAAQEPSLKESVRLFPNPTNMGFSTLNLTLESAAEVSVDLYTATGQKLATLMAPEQTISFSKVIDMGHYQPGSYFLKIHIDGATVVKKLTHL